MPEALLAHRAPRCRGAQRGRPYILATGAPPRRNHPRRHLLRTPDHGRSAVGGLVLIIRRAALLPDHDPGGSEQPPGQRRCPCPLTLRYADERAPRRERASACPPTIAPTKPSNAAEAAGLEARERGVGVAAQVTQIPQGRAAGAARSTDQGAEVVALQGIVSVDVVDHQLPPHPINRQPQLLHQLPTGSLLGDSRPPPPRPEPPSSAVGRLHPQHPVIAITKPRVRSHPLARQRFHIVGHGHHRLGRGTSSHPRNLAPHDRLQKRPARTTSWRHVPEDALDGPVANTNAGLTRTPACLLTRIVRVRSALQGLGLAPGESEAGGLAGLSGVPGVLDDVEWAEVPPARGDAAVGPRLAVLLDADHHAA